MPLRIQPRHLTEASLPLKLSSFLALLAFMFSTPARSDQILNFLGSLSDPCAKLLNHTAELRITDFYTKLLSEYRSTMSEDEYARELEGALKTKSYFKFQSAKSNQQAILSTLTQLHDIRKKGTLPNGDFVNGSEIEENIRNYLETELRTLRMVAGVVEESVKKTVRVRVPKQKLIGHTGEINDIVFSSDFTRSISAADDGTLRVWNLETGKLQLTLEGHRGAVYDIQINADFTRAISTSVDGTLIVWNLKTGEALKTLKGNRARALNSQVNAEFTRAVSAYNNKTLIIWNLETGMPEHRLKAHTAGGARVKTNADFTRAISTSDDGTLIVWDLTEGKRLQTLKWKGKSQSIQGFHFNADFTRAVTLSSEISHLISKNGTLTFWDLTTGKPLQEIDTLKGRSVQVNANFTEAIVISNNDMSVFELETGDLLSSVSALKTWILSAQVNSDFTQAIAIGGDTLTLWDLKTGKALRSIITDEGESPIIARATRDFTEVITGSRSGDLTLWNFEAMEP